jgi:hypothetical protein
MPPFSLFIYLFIYLFVCFILFYLFIHSFIYLLFIHFFYWLFNLYTFIISHMKACSLLVWPVLMLTPWLRLSSSNLGMIEDSDWWLFSTFSSLVILSCYIIFSFFIFFDLFRCLLYSLRFFVLTVRVFDHYEQMKTSTAKVPTQHCERFANEILLTLASTCQYNDVRHAALFALVCDGRMIGGMRKLLIRIFFLSLFSFFFQLVLDFLVFF